MDLEPGDDATPATPAGMLAARAGRARARQGLSLRALAEKLGYPHTYLSRVERGEQLPSEALAEALDDFYRTEELFADLLAVAAAAEVPPYGRRVLEEEKRAACIRTFNSSVVPGLLQTDDYASALFTASMPGKDAKKVALHVATRSHRRAMLDSATPPQYWALMDEAALRRPVGGAAVMAGQLRRILDVIERNSAVRVQVIPFSRGVHPLLGGSLSLLTLQDGETFAYVESFASGASANTPARVVELTNLLDVARSKALDGAESVSLIRMCLAGYEDGIGSS